MAKNKGVRLNQQFLKTIEMKFSKYWILITLLCLGGFFVRIIWINHDLPLSLDSTGYFWYSIDTSISNHFPDQSCGWKCSFPNTGWPSFLTLFFKVLPSENYLDFMNLQKYVGVIFSVLTVVPIFLISRFFLKKETAFLASSLFLFNPRIIENSILGITEPIYIFTFSVTLLTLLKWPKFPVISFGFLALLVIIRYEAILLILPIILIYFYKNRFNKKTIISCGISISIIFLILIPWGMMKNELTGQDGIISNVYAGPKYYSDVLEISNDKNEVIFDFISTGSIYTLRFLITSTFPILIITTPLGILFLLKKKELGILKIFFTIILFLLVPIFYGYSRAFLEVRYMLILFPIFSIISSFFFQEIFRDKQPKMYFTIIIVFVIFSTIIFLTWNNQEKNIEEYEFAKIVDSKMNVVNTYSGAMYLQEVRLEKLEKFPILRKDLPPGTNVLYLHMCNPNFIFDGCDQGYKNIEEFINKNKKNGLTHIVIDNGFLHNPFFKDDFDNSEIYPYLVKIFDSKDEGFKYYYAKIYLIDFKKIENIVNQN